MMMKIVQGTVTAHTQDVWNYTANASRKTGSVEMNVDVTAVKTLISQNIKFWGGRLWRLSLWETL